MFYKLPIHVVAGLTIGLESTTCVDESCYQLAFYIIKVKQIPREKSTLSTSLKKGFSPKMQKCSRVLQGLLLLEDGMLCRGQVGRTIQQHKFLIPNQSLSQPRRESVICRTLLREAWRLCSSSHLA